MFRIIKAGAGIGLTENLNYIKKAENGCYILCPEHDASGIVFEGVAYHLLDRAAMDELETVSLEQTDAGSEITKATEAGGIVFVTLAEAGSIDAETAAEHADLFAEWAFPVGYTVGQIRRYTPLKPDHEKRPFRFKLEGPFLRVSTMLLITPISPNFKGLKCSVFGRFRALQSRNIYGTIVVGSCKTSHHYNVQGVR